MIKSALAVTTATFALFLAACSTGRNESASGNAPAPSSFRVYVTNEASDDLTVIDPASNQVLSTVHLGKRPRGIHQSPDGKLLYVALSGTPIAGPDVDESTLPPPDKTADGIGVFDVEQGRLVRVIHGGSDPENFDLSKDGTQLYISNEDSESLSIVDIASGRVLRSARVGPQPEGVKTTPDGKLVWVTSEEASTVYIVDPVAGKVVRTIKVGHRPRSIAFLGDGSRAYVNAENDGDVVVIDCAKFAVVGRISLGKPGTIKPMGLVLTPDGSKLFVSTGRGRKIFAINTATNEILNSVEAGQRPWGIALSPDDKTLYSANGPSNNVSVIDVEKFQLTHTIPAGRSPWGVLILKR